MRSPRSKHGEKRMPRRIYVWVGGGGRQQRRRRQWRRCCINCWCSINRKCISRDVKHSRSFYGNEADEIIFETLLGTVWYKRENTFLDTPRITDTWVWGKKRKWDACGYLTLSPHQGFFLQPRKGGQKQTKHPVVLLATSTVRHSEQPPLWNKLVNGGLRTGNTWWKMAREGAGPSEQPTALFTSALPPLALLWLCIVPPSLGSLSYLPNPKPGPFP